MIIYQDILKRLSSCGWTTYRLVKEKQLGNGTLARIRAGMSISTDTLDTICRLCQCQPGDLIRWEEDSKQ